MCGISGIINTSHAQVKKQQIERMNALIRHRGPDDEGYFFENSFALAHRRLSILDLSSDGHQPMHYMEKYTITYNGEVYNYIEIKEELEKEGYHFFSSTDTEVILASYDKWGVDCVDKFNGMWAFALFDKEKNIIFCSRDRFGIKPFYYTEVNQQFLFGSEIKQLLEAHDTNYVNTKVLTDYLVTRIQEHTDETFFEKIYKLPASHNLIYDLQNHQYEIKRYYSIEVDPKISDVSEENAIKSYREELQRAISLRLRSDVKVGTCLSGGMDSSSVASIASTLYRAEGKNRFTAITALSTEKENDESAYAKEVADYAQLDWQTLQPSREDFLRAVDEVVYTQEEPFGSTSIFMQYFVMKKAKEIGCKVMLDGQGGDETLLGYEKYFPSAYLAYFKASGLIKTLKEVRSSRKNNTKMSLKWIFIYTVGSLFSSLRKMEHKRRCSFVKNEYLGDFEFFDDMAKSYSSINALQILEIERTNLPILLRYEDKNSMRHSVETRLPFIDYKTLQMALSINIRHKIHDGWTKYILRKAIEKNLPSDIVWRKNKLGFDAPEKTWLKSFEKEMMACIEGSAILQEVTDIKQLLIKYKRLDLRLKWRIYNIAKWEEVYNVKIR